MTPRPSLLKKLSYSSNSKTKHRSLPTQLSSAKKGNSSASYRNYASLDQVLVSHSSSSAGKDIWPSITENLFNSKQILSTNSHVKVALLFLYSGKIPKFSRSNAKSLTGMLHALRMSPNESNTATLIYSPQTEDDIKQAQELKLALPVKEKLIRVLNEAFCEYVRVETVSHALRCIDAVSGICSVAPSLHVEYEHCLTFVRQHEERRGNAIPDMDKIPAFMRMQIGQMGLSAAKEQLENESIIVDQRALSGFHTCKSSANNTPPQASSSGKKAMSPPQGSNIIPNAILNDSLLSFLWKHQISSTADCQIITHSKKRIAIHAWVIALICPGINAYLCKHEVKSERSRHFQEDDAFLKAMEVVTKHRTSKDAWENGFLIHLDELIPDQMVPSAVVQQLVQYLYTKKIVVTRKNAQHLKVLYDAFMGSSSAPAHSQLSFILDQMCRVNFTVENVLKYYATTKSVIIKAKAEKFVEKNWRKVNERHGEEIEKFMSYTEFRRMAQ
eukprot:CAMPEP_0117453508 /NCGR_PEP_ID=MMETSP0759-20121206/10263_1 /TAXON_ID=63605 /ORGANISM="Percolomonas cosmopolitus, Strain WS" /LENGTH=499 /DNA_ID=CAMNT_0005246549 /DNA_START=54 /DNA_END=1550 /DNA_ORIENTATION=-